MKFNKKIILATLSIMVSLNAFGSEYKIDSVKNTQKVVKEIQKLKQKNSVSTRGYRTIHINNFVYDEKTDSISAIRDSNGNFLFYLVYNKIQNDPTKKFSLDEKKYLQDGYTCDYIGSEPEKCSGEHFYQNIVWNSNSVGAKIFLKKDILDNFTSNVRILYRQNINRDIDSLKNKPFMDVYIDKNAYLKAEFTLISGGTISATTPKPIPFDEPVYIQANEHGEKYEVGWKSLKTGESSIGKASHQIPPLDNQYGLYPKKVSKEEKVSLIFNNVNFNDLYNYLFMKDYFWNTKIPMFENIDKKDLSDMVVYQNDTSLKIDGTLVNKIISDITKGTNNFKEKELRVYIDDNSNVEAIDIRQY